MERSNTQPDITIAIPTYNRANELARTLLTINRAVANAPHIRTDVLVSDNASTDHTQAVVESFKAKNPQKIPVTYFRQEENRGFDPNYIDAITKSSGKYVLTLGDDDLLYPQSLKLLGSYAKKERAALVHFNASRFDHISGSSVDNSLVDNAGNKLYNQKDQFFFDPIFGYFPFMGTNATTISTLMWNRELATKYAFDSDIQRFNSSFIIQCHLYSKIAVDYPQFAWVGQTLVDYGVNMNAPISDFGKEVGARFNGDLLDHLLDLGYSTEGVRYVRETQSDTDNLFNVGQIKADRVGHQTETYSQAKDWYQKTILK